LIFSSYSNILGTLPEGDSCFLTLFYGDVMYSGKNELYITEYSQKRQAKYFVAVKEFTDNE